MNTLRKLSTSRRLAIGCLLAVALAGPALAQSYAFSFWQGPADMIIPMNDFRKFHSHLTNTGTEADTYTVTVTRDHPATWMFNVCYDGICWPEDQTVFQVPIAGAVYPGESMAFEFDVTSLFAEGEGVYTVHIVSNNNAAAQRTVTFRAKSPTEPYAILLSPGEGVLGASVNDFVRFEPQLYNAGTEPDAYTLTMVRNIPEYWQATYCFDGLCYAPWEVQTNIPDGAGQIPGGGHVPLEIDFTTLTTAGTGSVTIYITSQTQGNLLAVATFTVTTGSVVGVSDVTAAVLSRLQAAPNPFNPRTEISFEVGGAAALPVVVDIVDAGGRRVRSLAADVLLPGRHSLVWDGFNQAGQPAPAGVYLARVQVDGAQQTLKLSLVK